MLTDLAVALFKVIKTSSSATGIMVLLLEELSYGKKVHNISKISVT